MTKKEKKMKTKLISVLVASTFLVSAFARDIRVPSRVPRIPTIPGNVIINKPILRNKPVLTPVITRKFKLENKNSLGKNAPIPIGATKISEAEFKKLHSQGLLKLTAPEVDGERVRSEMSEHQKNVDFVKRNLGNNRELLNRLTKRPTGVTRKGKNYFHTIRDNRGKKQVVETMGDEFVYSELANTLKSVNNKNNKLNLYNLAYSKLPKKYLRTRTNLKSPKQLETANISTINSNLSVLVVDTRIIGNIIGALDLPPAGRPSSCNKEIGYAASNSTMGDQTGNKCSHHADGIFRNVKYPMKWYATCVKNQGGRGTCVSFAATSAAETAYAVNKNKWYNFSEQNLYNAAKMKWYPSTYGDGLNTSGIMQDLVNRNYKFGYEFAWDYNPSYSRDKNDANKTYSKSCNNYNGEHCSNTNHQGKKVCTKILFWTFCGYTEQTAETSLEINGVAQIWDVNNTAASVNTAKLASNLKLPMVLSIPVTPSFDNAPVTGYANYVGPNEGNRGGHAVAVLGVVENSQLPATAPQGAGGGYFIVKNSWGACWKDAGYIYLPIDWVKAYARSLTVVTSI